MKRADALLLMGSNVGDRSHHLRLALRGVARLPKTRLIKASRVHETKPVGPSRRPFLNQALKIRTGLSPMGLLIELKRLEISAGRRPGPRWGPRPLDIDIIAYANKRVQTPWLRVPHQRAAVRAFVLTPLCEIAPSARLGRSTARGLLFRLKSGPGSVKIFSSRGE